LVFIGMDHGTTGISFCIMSNEGEILDSFKIDREDSKSGKISAINEICRLNELGVETIITDHHLPPTELPAAYAIVNPHLSTKLLFKELSGAGVAYKLISYLYGYLGRSREAEDFLALAAIGTVADIVPLVQDNRYLVEMGLRQINQKPSLGILELLRNAKLSESEVNAGKIAWIIGPRINAAGRLENASLAYRLLTAQDRQEAIALAVQLENLNARRQDLTNRFFQLAKQQVDINQKILFFQDEQCPKGVVGLVAGRICEEYNLPCIAINTEAELCVGSCRSIEGFDITKALVSCSSLLKRFGGHAQAAGFSAKKEQLPAIKAHLERYAYDNLKDRDPRPILHIDTLVKLDELSLEVVTEIKRMEPFGEGNKAPLFLSENLSVLDWRVMGKEEEHMLVKFTDGERLLEATAFNMKAKLSPLMKDRLDIVYNLEINEYNGRRNLRANLVDYRIHK